MIGFVIFFIKEIGQVHHRGCWWMLFFGCCAGRFSDSHCICFGAWGGFAPPRIGSVKYKCTFGCGRDWVGGTSSRLDLRIRQHLPARILNLRHIRGQLANTSGSSIVEHMINSRECVADFNVDRFSILSRSHSLFHLKMLETLYVRSLQPSLRKQRDCLLGLNVISL